MVTKLYESKAKNGKSVVVDYDQFRLGDRYYVKFILGSVKETVTFGTFAEAMRYAKIAENGGMNVR